MADKKGPQLYQATKSFLIEGNLWVKQGDTAVAGHSILKGRIKSGHFVPFEPTFGAEPEAEAPKPKPEPKVEVVETTAPPPEEVSA
jgi:hypothetical protein